MCIHARIEVSNYKTPVNSVENSHTVHTPRHVHCVRCAPVQHTLYTCGRLWVNGNFAMASDAQLIDQWCAWARWVIAHFSQLRDAVRGFECWWWSFLCSMCYMSLSIRDDREHQLICLHWTWPFAGLNIKAILDWCFFSALNMAFLWPSHSSQSYNTWSAPEVIREHLHVYKKACFSEQLLRKPTFLHTWR